MSEDKRNTGREAQMHNIRAAVNIAETVRSTLGPAGMDKLLADSTGHTVVTNDGVTILRELDVAHPGGKMLVEASKTQEAVCKDGTTSVVVLAGQMLALSEGLLLRGVHPNIIIRAYYRASNLALDNLDPIEIDVLDAAKTALRGKAAESDLSYAASLCKQAADKANGDLDRIRVITQAGGSLRDSYVHDGIVLNKEFSNSVDATEVIGGKILLLNGGLEGFDLNEVQMQVTSPDQLQAIQQQEYEILSEAASMVAGLLGKNGVVFSRDGVHEAVAHYLAKHDIPVITRLQQSDMEALSRLLNLPIYHRITDVEGEIPAVENTVKQERIGDLDFVTVSGLGEATTLVVRGATRQTLDEFERAFDDAVGVTCLSMTDGSKGFPGGGAAYSAAAVAVREHATTQSNMSARERMCIEAYADALEIVPAAIASNAGMDPLDVVMELRSADSLTGLYIDEEGKGSICNTLKQGVVEPESLVRQVIASATEVATSILRIDDIIARREG